MIRNLAVRGRHMTVAHGSSTTNVVVSNSASTKRAATAVVVGPAMESIRCYSYDYNNSSHHQQHHRRHHSRSPSPSPSKRSQQVIPSNNNIKVMSPRPNNNNTQRSYGTAPLTESFMGSHVTHDSPVRHTTTYHSFHEATPLMSMQQQHQQEMTATTFHEDYDEWNTLSGYIATGNSGPAAAETILSATSSSTSSGSSATTDSDMDVVSDDEEWLPSSLGVSSAEQVLAMMDTSYYHASYQAKNTGHENQK